MKRISTPVETDNLCCYGCNNVAKFINGSSNLMCRERSNSCPAVKLKNSLGVKNSGRNYTDNYKNLPQKTKDAMAWSRGKFTKTIFEYGRGGNHKLFLIGERGHYCESCRNNMWLGQLITLELEHINGDNQDNKKENLKLLCPNCHSQTNTWKGRNIKKRSAKQQISDSDFIDALNTTRNIRQALLKLGLTPKGGNYKRANELLCGGLVER